jgi:hypothetical protein
MMDHSVDHRRRSVVKFIKKNYALESVPGTDVENQVGGAGAILRLNTVGRQYLIEDGSSVLKGVEVLSAVRSGINCVVPYTYWRIRGCATGAPLRPQVIVPIMADQ